MNHQQYLVYVGEFQRMVKKKSMERQNELNDLWDLFRNGQIEANELLRRATKKDRPSLFFNESRYDPDNDEDNDE